ncbi:hypothetical protein GALMADRAFT_226790 [Galerina marginata CBS 339.88]|uniref:Uncharacterized protein n=1 Tax=Galerina marginata (strain CBS 339.88) TaxID=685588 RepID=A0A067T5D4_GALM3|nr:hypothetical protein GALMADRAFT_226790 [Galerina marginata CBS 339.88]
MERESHRNGRTAGQGWSVCWKSFTIFPGFWPEQEGPAIRVEFHVSVNRKSFFMRMTWPKRVQTCSVSSVLCILLHH